MFCRLLLSTASLAHCNPATAPAELKSRLHHYGYRLTCTRGACARAAGVGEVQACLLCRIQDVDIIRHVQRLIACVADVLICRMVFSDAFKAESGLMGTVHHLGGGHCHLSSPSGVRSVTIAMAVICSLAVDLA